MALDISLNTFIGQAAALGETSDKTIVAGGQPGTLAGIKVSFFTRHSTSFQNANRALWQSFSASLAANFGADALPPQLRGLVDSGKPLTARNIIEITKDTLGRARAAATIGLSTLLAVDGPDRAGLLAQQGERLADAYRSLKDREDFSGGSALQKQALLAEHLRQQDARENDLPADVLSLGLRDIPQGVTFGRDETSIEDLVRTGRLRAGDAIGLISSGTDAGHKRYIFHAIKQKGVEPGFLVQKNWLPSHENAMTGRGPDGKNSPLFRAAADRAAGFMRNLLHSSNPDTAMEAFIVLTGYLKPSPSAHQTLLNQVFSGLRTPAEALADFPAEALRACAEDQVFSPEAAYHRVIANDARAQLRSTMREFTERHVIKLDYNESDRSTLTRSLRLPERIKKSHGGFFQFFRRLTVREANESAVAEAVANDITRRLGVPAQKLSLLKGQYGDGSPKLLLDSTYISGQDGAPYRDFDCFIRDGYLDRDLLRASGHDGVIRQLGSYKAVFMLLGDRDAVGSKGQNKGFVGNSFAAIDPGHSLEGSRITVRDDFSFSYKLNGLFTKGFQNFSMFDDSPLSEKMSGWDRIVQEIESGGIDRLFEDYEAQFGNGQGDARLNFQSHLDEMKTELMTRYRHMKETLGPRLALYQGREGDPAGLGPALLDSLENVEKLSSQTSETSPNGQVKLQHLRVEKRVPWDMARDAEGIRINCRSASARAKSNAALSAFLTAKGVPHTLNQRGEILIASSNLTAFNRSMSEDNVRAYKMQQTA